MVSMYAKHQDPKPGALAVWGVPFFVAGKEKAAPFGAADTRSGRGGSGIFQHRHWPPRSFELSRDKAARSVTSPLVSRWDEGNSSVLQRAVALGGALLCVGAREEKGPAIVPRRSRWMSYCLIQACSRNTLSIASPKCSCRDVTLSIGARSDSVFGGIASGFVVGPWGCRRRPGANWAPGRITGRGHRRPRLYRPANLSCHHWALNIPGVWGQSPQAFARSEANQPPDSRDRRACVPTSHRRRRRGARRSS